ncbi:MAG: polysaccharide deacetylase family protein [Pirellulales bacterium]
MKPFLLHIYLCGTSGYRQRTLRELVRKHRVPIVVPVFHRVSDDKANAWTTSRADFRQAIEWLRKHFDLISLEEAQRRITSGANDRPSVSITFDDGYAANCDYAIPLLVENAIPCTYFVSSGPVLDGASFDHDLAMGNHVAPNTVAELRELAAAGIEIGAHSRTHADLGRVADADRLFDELAASRDELQNAVGLPVRYFAFPFGMHANLSAAAFHLARENGFAAACSAYGGYNFPGDDAFHIQRRCFDGLRVRLRNWATLDPLHHWRVRRFDYGEAPENWQAALSVL